MAFAAALTGTERSRVVGGALAFALILARDVGRSRSTFAERFNIYVDRG